MSKVALIVDDSLLIRKSLSQFFEVRGFVVESAADGSEALEVLARVVPDVIVTDMRMPKISGSELITAVKGKDETARIPIIVVTGKANGLGGADERADFAVYKDIDMETQLDAALEAVWEEKGRGQGSGK